MVDLKGIYYSIEDKWYSLIDKISDKVSFVGKAVDKIEEKGIPSFPLAIIFFLIIIFLIFFMTFGTGQSMIIGVYDSEQNPIEGAIVSVYLDGDFIVDRETDASGKAIFFLEDKQYSVKIDKEGYNSITRDFLKPTGQEEVFSLSLEDVLITRAITLKKASGELISGSGIVTYTCVGENIQKTGTYTNGIFTADFSDCQEITLQNVSGYTVVEGRAFFSGTNDVILEEVEISTGTITVSINASEDLTGLRVTARGEDGSPVQVKTVGENNEIVIFEEMPVKKYYITTHSPTGVFEDYQGNLLGEIKELRKDETISFNINLQKSLNSTITVNIKDLGTSLPITGAEVKLLSLQNQNLLNTEITGVNGQVVFNVPDETSYTISVEHPQYLIGQNRTVSSGQTVNFDLVKADETNSQSLLVTILDPRKEPISNTKVTLKKLDDTIIGEKTTGVSGEVEFYNLELANYYVYAVKDGFTGTPSTSIQIMPRRQNLLEVILDIGEGDFEIDVSNDSLEKLRGVRVRAINYFTREIEEEKITNELGKAFFKIRADKKIFFVIEDSDYLPYHTIATYPDASSTITREVKLVKETGRLNSRILGVFQAGNEIGSERVISPGVYTIRAVLEVPMGNFSEAGLHIRLGKATENVLNLVEEDIAKLGRIESSANITTKGTTFYPPANYSIDSRNITSGIAKWVETRWTNISEGSFELEAELIIEETTLNTGINLWYRGWAKGATTLRDPINNNTGHEFYASAKNYLLTSGIVSFCTGSFCTSNQIKTLSGSGVGRVQQISNRFNAIQDNTYELTTNITSRKALSNAVLEIDGRGIAIEKIIVNGVERQDNITLGNLPIDSHTEIKILFKTIIAGTNEINISISSATQKELEQSIVVSVPTNKKFSLDLIPRQIIPYIPNSLFVEIKDGATPLRDVLVEIKSNNTILATIKTNAEGLAHYTLSPPNIGDVITITARREGFDDFVIEKKVDEGLLLITPPQISETIKIGEIASIEETILLQNATTQKLRIDRVGLEGELESFLNITFDETIIGKEINVEQDINSFIKIRPNTTAQRLRQPRTVEGMITINVSVEGANKTFENKIPVRIRLSMPGYLDSDRCLRITPSKIEFNTSTREVTQTLEIFNSCTAEGVQINLQEIEARLNESSKFGTINVSGPSFLNTNINNTFTKVSDLFERNARETIIVRFTPSTSVNTGKQNLELIFRAKNVIEQDVSEEIETRVGIDITMSNLMRCIEIREPAGGVVLDVAGWNLGQNRIMMSNLSAHMQPYQGIRQPFGMMPFGMNSMLPFMNPQQGPVQYEQSNFIIKNNCAVDVEVSLEPDSRLTVSDERMVIASNSDATITISPGYTLGKYNIGVSAKVYGTEESRSRIGTVNATVRRLGEIDKDCIKVNVNKLTFNSFLYKAEKYRVHNHCYDMGVQLNRTNIVTIKCDAPNVQTRDDIRYLQVGQEQFFGNQYPITPTYPTPHAYMNPMGDDCGVNRCAFIVGTRTFDHRTIPSQMGTIEEITFEVMPNTQYMPQRRLFDSQRNTFGLFSSLGDIRQWATETDARTGVYGTLNVSYSNQYGSMQCMTFPVTIEDNWRMLESIDSAINWGDPNANPQDCVKSEERKALDTIEYWKKDDRSTQGIIPDIEYDARGVYRHIGQPPAVRIGPMPTATNIMPHYNIPQQQIQRLDKSNASNCGLADTISNLNHQKEFGGVRINVGTARTGSLLSNELGPNLWLEIDRSGIQHTCVYINTRVTGTLTRAINFKKAEITWPIRAIVTKPDFVMPQGFNPERDCFIAGTEEIDCERKIRELISKSAQEIFNEIQKYPVCARQYTLAQIQAIKEQSEETGTCVLSSREYGFDRIDKSNARELSFEELEDYCEGSWCNNEMLQLFLMKQLGTIQEKLRELNNDKIDEGIKLSELYTVALKIDQNVCATPIKFYASEKNILISEEFNIQKYLEGEDNLKEAIEKAQGEGAIVAMNTLLDRIKNDGKIDFEELFLKYNKKVNGINQEHFIAVEDWLKINEAVARTENITADTSVNVRKKNYSSNDIREIAIGKPIIVRAIKVEKKLSEEEKDLVYKNNPELNDISELTIYNKELENSKSNLFLTGEEQELPIFRPELFDRMADNFNKISGLQIIAKGLRGVGEYKARLEGNTRDILNNNGTIEFIVEKKQDVGKAGNNILLKNGFNFTKMDNTTIGNSRGIIIQERNFYTRTPVQLIVSLHALEPTLKYRPQNVVTENTLINWNYTGRILTDQRIGNNFVVTPGVTPTAKELRGIYYYPKDGHLFFETENRDGAVITGRTILDKEPRTQTLTIRDNIGLLELSIQEEINLGRIIQYVKDNKACITDNGNTIIWNEIELAR